MNTAKSALTIALAALLSAAAPPGIPPADTPAVAAEVAADVAEADRLAGEDLRQPLFLCRADGLAAVRDAMLTRDQWLTPTKAFDNLFFIGNAFVGVWVLNTSEGLILFDSTESADEARDHLVPGLKALGLDPAAIKYVIVTHGHWDHFGGSAWLQRTYGARIGLSAADWAMIAALPEGAPERHGAELPRRDLTLSDGQVLKLGDTHVRLYLTPGHTPGTVSAIVPAHTGSRTVALSLLGSVAFPASLGPTPRAGGFLNTHIFADGTRQRLDALHTGTGSAAGNPFLIGSNAVARYYGVLHHCLLAAEARASGGGAGAPR